MSQNHPDDMIRTNPYMSVLVFVENVLEDVKSHFDTLEVLSPVDRTTKDDYITNLLWIRDRLSDMRKQQVLREDLEVRVFPNDKLTQRT